MTKQFMVVTDLDGTLLQTGGTISKTNLATLISLRHRQIVRVIATGRSLYSARQVLTPSFPIDYVIFSSGAGIIHWQTQRLLITHHLSAEEIALALPVLIRGEIDFMLHHPIPDNHHFSYRSTGKYNPDFIRRHDHYHNFASPLTETSPVFEKACQIVGIEPRKHALSKYEMVKTQLRSLKVIRSTSPLDGESIWIEIFPKTVSKALASEWLARNHAIDPAAIVAIGNDYNDLDLLRWAGESFVVQNAPTDLKQSYKTVSSNDADGFSEAVKIWIKD
jgi:HAD superfamily hydrolase (TIGR01484 family)